MTRQPRRSLGIRLSALLGRNLTLKLRCDILASMVFGRLLARIAQPDARGAVWRPIRWSEQDALLDYIFMAKFGL